MSQYLYIAGLVLTLVVGPLVGYAVARWKLKDQISVQYEQAPLKVIEAALASKEREAIAARLSLDNFITVRMAQDREEHAQDLKERDRLIEVLTGIRDDLVALKDELVAHRAEEHARTGTIFDKLDDLKTEILRKQA